MATGVRRWIPNSEMMRPSRASSFEVCRGSQLWIWAMEGQSPHRFCQDPHMRPQASAAEARRLHDTAGTASSARIAEARAFMFVRGLAWRRVDVTVWSGLT